MNFQQTTIDMAMAQKIAIGKVPFGRLGPDLGFLRLPEDLSSGVAATNVFFIAQMREREILENAAAGPYFDALVGAVAEMTWSAEPISPKTQRKCIEARVWLGNVVRAYEGDSAWTCWTSTCRPMQAFERPPVMKESAEVPLWRVKLGADLRSVADVRVTGVAFYQTPLVDGHRLITCHGPRSIYDALLRDIRSDLNKVVLLGGGP
jgi:hypothetical protein